MTRTLIGHDFHRTSAAAVTLLVFAVSSARPQEKLSPTIDDIQKAWQVRQDRVRSARFTWKEQRTWPKGSISSIYGPAAFERIPEARGKIMPPADKTVVFYILSLWRTIKNDLNMKERSGRTQNRISGL
jgi:hypothetical protein